MCGPATGGLIVSQWTSRHLDLPSVFAEHAKEEGYTPETAGDGPLRAPFVLRRGYDQAVRGKRVLVVDDVINTGLSVRETADAVRGPGARWPRWARCARAATPRPATWAATASSTSPRSTSPPGRRGLRPVPPGVPVNTRYAHGADFLAQQAAGWPAVQPIPLHPEDRAILALECDTVAGHTCKVAVLGRPAPPVDALARSIGERLAAVPALTRRLGGTDTSPRGWRTRGSA